MSPIAFVVPGRLDTRTGGSIYDRRVVEGLQRRGLAIDVVELDASFPFPDRRSMEQARQQFDAIDGGGIAIVDGLILGAIPEVIRAAADRMRIVALMHLPLTADPGMDTHEARSFEEGEAQSLAASSVVVVTGRATLRMLERYALPRGRVIVLEPGTDPKPVAIGSGGSLVHLLCVAALNPGKGHDVLLRALAESASTGWRLTCAGSLTRHPRTVDRVRETIRTFGLEDRVVLPGELDDTALDCAHDASDLFVLATLQETYGMVVADALARGLAVVSTATGAIPALVGDSAGVIVPPGDVSALASALTRVIEDTDFRWRLSEGARQVRGRLPTWDAAVDGFHDVLVRMSVDG
jgi:glycosyltransferase involved in cell wall biosynthesis